MTAWDGIWLIIFYKMHYVTSKSPCQYQLHKTYEDISSDLIVMEIYEKLHITTPDKRHISNAVQFVMYYF